MDFYDKLQRWEQMEFWDVVKELSLHKHSKSQMMFNGVAMVAILGMSVAILGKIM